MAYRCIPENRLRRFEKRIDIDSSSGCWNWTGPLTFGGYGVSCIDGKRTVAHRALWEFLRGEVPEGLDLDHLCRNRKCVNPDHLEPVTRSENLNRGFAARGCKNGHEFAPENFSVVNRADGRTERRCKLCHRMRNSAAKRRKSSAS